MEMHLHNIVHEHSNNAGLKYATANATHTHTHTHTCTGGALLAGKQVANSSRRHKTLTKFLPDSSRGESSVVAAVSVAAAAATGLLLRLRR